MEESAYFYLTGSQYNPSQGKSEQELKQGRNLEEGTKVAVMEELCFLASFIPLLCSPSSPTLFLSSMVVFLLALSLFIFCFVLFLFFVLFLKARVLCSFGAFTGTQSVDKASLKLTEIFQPLFYHVT